MMFDFVAAILKTSTSGVVSKFNSLKDFAFTLNLR